MEARLKRLMTVAVIIAEGAFRAATASAQPHAQGRDHGRGFGRSYGYGSRSASEPASHPLRFESRVKVLDRTPVDPNMALAVFLKDVDLRYGTSGPGPPTRREMESLRPNVTPGANLLPFFQWFYEQAARRKD